MPTFYHVVEKPDVVYIGSLYFTGPEDEVERDALFNDDDDESGLKDEIANRVTLILADLLEENQPSDIVVQFYQEDTSPLILVHYKVKTYLNFIPNFSS